jgi:flagella basal body P-ring formation protein FlgA
MRWPIQSAVLLIAVTSLVPGRAAAQGIVQIQLLATASTTKSIVTLADIATIEGGDGRVRNQIRALDITELGAAPSTDTVRESQVDLRLQLARIPQRLYRLDGASETLVTRDHAELNDQVVIEAIRQPLATLWDVEPDSIRIRLTQPLARTMSSVPETDDFRLEPFIRESFVPGRARISIGLYDGDDLAQTFSVSVETSIRRRVAVAQARIRPQHVITAEDIQIEQRDMTGREALNVPDVVINRMASRWLRAGQVIQSRDVYKANARSAAMIVKRNSVVRLVARKHGLRVTVRGGMLLRDSRVGESVPVVNPTSKKTVVGRLVSPTEVEVPF